MSWPRCGTPGDREVDWVHGFGEVAADGRRAVSLPRGAGIGVRMPGAPHFGPAQRYEIRWSRPRTTDSFLADIATHSWALISGPAEREAAFARVRAYLAGRPETASGEFEVPMVTLVWRTLRR